MNKESMSNDIRHLSGATYSDSILKIEINDEDLNKIVGDLKSKLEDLGVFVGYEPPSFD